MTTFEVIVVGAGTVGLFLACELAVAGVSVLVLERELSQESVWKEFPLGRRVLQPPSVEAVYRRGLLDKFTSNSHNNLNKQGIAYKSKRTNFVGHFAGLMLDGDKVDFDRFKYYLPGHSSLPVTTTSAHVEAIFLERAQVLGVQVLRGKEITAIHDSGSSVTVSTVSQVFTASWLVGCDGGKSFVRKSASIPFQGTGPEFTGYITTCDLDKPELLKPGFHPTPNGMYIAMGADKYYAAMDFDLSVDRNPPTTREHFQNVLQRVTGKDIKVEKLYEETSFTARSAQAANYRNGRVLLAGDAAHIHSPLGGQGLNTGIGDAMNLGWKLAATVKGHGAPGLLDSYHDERYPVGAAVLEWTRAQMAVLRPDPFSQAIQKGGAEYG